jgi:hypothetical protein
VANKLIDEVEKMNIKNPMIKYVLFTMANHANKESMCCCSYNTIAKYTGLSKRFVINAIKELEKSELILKKHRFHKCNKRSTSNEYLVLPDFIHKVIQKG